LQAPKNYFEAATKN